MKVDYWIDTGWACGGIAVEDGRVIPGGAPVFKRFIGQSVERLRRRYRIEETEPEQMEFEKVLVDGNYWARKFFAVHKELLARVDGRIVRTGLTHGFLLGLANLKDQYKGRIIVCWDAGNTRRRSIDPEYKAERRDKKEDWEEAELFDAHLKVLRFFLRLTGVRQAKRRGDEGDDILYTLAKRAEGKALIVSNDHDMYQALGGGTYQLLSKREGEVLLSAKRFEREYGLTPEQYGQAMAVSGCSGDGVAGIAGVGIKTASDWVRQWPRLVPAILGEDDTPLADWLPEVNGKNVVVRGTQFFPEGSKGPVKKLRTAIEEPWTVHKTRQLTQLYDVWPVQFFGGKYDEDSFILALERAELHECETRLDLLRKLHK